MAKRGGERMSLQLVIVGNPNCRRVPFWQEALRKRRWPTAEIVHYTDLLTERTRLADQVSAGNLVRLETAAENWDTFKLLLEWGFAPACEEDYPALEKAELKHLEYQRGRLVHPRQVYLGFSRLVQILTEEVEAAGATSLNHAEDIALCFDKPRCQERLASEGIPIPATFGSVADYATVRNHLRQCGRIMVKLAHGSGAAGCVALHASNGQVRALTTVEESFVEGQSRLYCSKRIRGLNDESEIAALVDRLSIERIQVEEWLPKARWDGCNFDLRIVTIAGEPRHGMARVSASPFTNMTLGNRRGDLPGIKERIGDQSWKSLHDTCARVASLFPRSFTLGIDILIRPDFRRHAVLEVNAFGDLLLGQLDAGEDTYTATLSALERLIEPVMS
jgi:hypothetical protein